MRNLYQLNLHSVTSCSTTWRSYHDTRLLWHDFTLCIFIVSSIRAMHLVACCCTDGRVKSMESISEGCRARYPPDVPGRDRVWLCTWCYSDKYFV